MTDKEQIDALKAQVNCLRDAIIEASYHIPSTYFDVAAVLAETPEKCLAEMKAKTIKDALRATINPDLAYLGYGIHQQPDENKTLEMRLAIYAEQLLEQAK